MKLISIYLIQYIKFLFQQVVNIAITHISFSNIVVNIFSQTKFGNLVFSLIAPLSVSAKYP